MRSDFAYVFSNHLRNYFRQEIKNLAVYGWGGGGRGGEAQLSMMLFGPAIVLTSRVAQHSPINKWN